MRKQKVCARNHTYKGQICPVCWPAGAKKAAKKKKSQKKK